MTEALVDAVDVVKRLGHGAGEVQALKGVSLSLNGGELVLLMGPSGSGKTTLLSVMGCLMTPTRGIVRVRGRSTAGAGPEDLAKLRRDHIGFSFNPTTCFPPSRLRTMSGWRWMCADSDPDAPGSRRGNPGHGRPFP